MIRHLIAASLLLSASLSFASADDIYFDFSKVATVTIVKGAVWISGIATTRADIGAERIPTHFRSRLSSDAATVTACANFALEAKANSAQKFFLIGSTDGTFYACGLQ